MSISATHDTLAQEMGNLQRRFVQGKVRAAKKTLSLILKKNPHLWITLCDSALSMGYNPDGESFHKQAPFCTYMYIYIYIVLDGFAIPPIRQKRSKYNIEAIQIAGCKQN